MAFLLSSSIITSWYSMIRVDVTSFYSIFRCSRFWPWGLSFITLFCLWCIWIYSFYPRSNFELSCCGRDRCLIGKFYGLSRFIYAGIASILFFCLTVFVSIWIFYCFRVKLELVLNYFFPLFIELYQN